MAQGFSQQPGVDFDEVYAPVVKFDSLRLLLALAVYFQWEIIQLDVQAAFLYGILQEEIYMRLPDGYFPDSPDPATNVPVVQTNPVTRNKNLGPCGSPGLRLPRDTCARLHKALYGLKQSPREWYARLTSFLELGYQRCNFDPCVFIHPTSQVIIAVYVDDISVYGLRSPALVELLHSLKGEFKLSDIGDIHWLLGIQITRNCESGYSECKSDKCDSVHSISLNQSVYIDQILLRFGMTNCNPVTHPMDTKIQLRKFQDGDVIADVTLYQQLIGSLMYLVTGTRPDLAFTVSKLAQFNSKPTTVHMAAAKRVLRYIKKTRDESSQKSCHK